MYWLWFAVIGGVLGGTPAEEETAPPTGPVIQGEVTLGQQTVVVDGSAPRFYQYYLPPRNLFLRQLYLRSEDEQGREAFTVLMYNWGEDYQQSQVSCYFPYSASALEYEYERARFFFEPLAQPSPPLSRRREHLLRLHLYPVAEVNGELRVRARGVSEPNLLRGTQVNYHTTDYQALVGVSGSKGNLHLTYDRLGFADYSRRQPKSTTRMTGAEYFFSWRDIASLAVSYAHSTVAQEAVGESKVRAYQISGFCQPRGNYSAFAQYRFLDIQQPLTLNAYSTQRSIATLRVDYRPSPRWTVRGGFQYRAIERLNAVQSAREVPKWRFWWLRFDTRLPRSLQVSGRFEVRDLLGDPRSAIPGTPDPRPLVPDKERKVELKVNGPLAGNGFAYATFQDQYRKNTFRRLSYTLRTFGAGVFYQLNPLLSVNAEHVWQDWRSSAAELAPALTDARIGTVGFAYQPLANTYLNGSYTRYRTSGAGPVDDDVFFLAARYQWRPGQEIGLEVLREDYEATLFPQLNFDTWQVQVNYTTAF